MIVLSSLLSRLRALVEKLQVFIGVLFFALPCKIRELFVYVTFKAGGFPLHCSAVSTLNCFVFNGFTE